ACGTPVITSNAASLPELAGAAARQIDPTDVAQLAEALTRLCTEEATRQEIIRRGFEQVEKFTWQKTAAETLQAYRQLLG
ncbi:MAG: glycosyltransferase, partial [Anaerolineae bacterium]|nr:glycosyltransferase [Anaerolineae bacterium]